MRRQERFPGEPAEPDRTFGPLGGLVDDVFYWQKTREHMADADARRLIAAARPRSVNPIGQLLRWLRSR
jgi:hypothetical protein